MFSLFPSPFIHISSQKSLNALLLKQGSRSYTLISSPFAGCALGIPWWVALLKDAPHLPSILDCGASSALALQALHAGISGVVCRHPTSDLLKYADTQLFQTRPTSFDVKDII